MNSQGVFDLVRELLPLLIPIILIDLGLMIYCLVDLWHREKTYGSKIMWVLLIVLVNLLGSILYLVIGRQE